MGEWDSMKFQKRGGGLHREGSPQEEVGGCDTPYELWLWSTHIYGGFLDLVFDNNQLKSPAR